MGSKKNAIWRVVVADRRSPRDGRFIEMIGHYNPQTQPSQIVIDRERLQHWLDRGAEPTNTVRKLMRAEASGPPAAAVDEETAPPKAAEAPAPADEGPGADAGGEGAASGDAEADAEDGADSTTEGDPESG